MLDFKRINNVENIKPSTFLHNSQSSIVVHRVVWWSERSLRVVGMEVSMPCPVHMTRQGGIDSNEIYMGSHPPSGLDMKRYDTLDNQNSGEKPHLCECCVRL